MTGWRLGWAMGPKELVAPICKIHQFGIMSAPTTAQFAGIEPCGSVKDDVQRMKRQYGRAPPPPPPYSRPIWLGNCAIWGWIVFEPLGAFYLCSRPSVPQGFPLRRFATSFWSTKKSCCCAGNALAKRRRSCAQFHNSYSMAHLREAMRRMRAFLRSLKEG